MMKKYFLLIVMALAAIVSCKQEEEIVPEIKVPAASEKIFSEGIEFEAAEETPQGGQSEQTCTLQFTATDNWNATVEDTKASNWVSVVPVSGGAGDVTMSVTALPNTTFSPRQAKVTIKCGPAVKTFTISQAAAKPAYINVTEVILNPETLTLVEGESADITATVKPDNATDKTVTWSTSDASVATVNDGKVTAVKEGKAMIAAAAGNVGAACEVTVTKQIIHVTSIEFDQTSLNLAVSDSYVLNVMVLPDNATDKSYVLASTNPAIADIDNAGKVTAKSAGTVTITATATDGGLVAACEVTVFVPVVPVASVALDKATLTLTKGQSETLKATVLPTDATNPKVTWTSSDESVASVADGVVTAKKSGTATITAMAENQSATCEVTVTNPATSLKLDRNTLALVEGASEQLVATVEPADADELPVKWKSSDTGVATVDANGNVIAIKEGNAVVTASCGNFWVNCQVTVAKQVFPATAIKLDKTSLALTKGATATLNATVEPANATDKTVVWKSGNTAVVTVDQNGNVTALKSGSTTIEATCGNVSATCAVEVTTPVTGISLDCSGKALTEGETFTLAATVAPADADDKTVSWSSSDTGVATVDNSGNVTAKAEGNATITASCAGFSASCDVTVAKQIIPVTSLALDNSQISLMEGDNATLVATVSPDNATSKTVIWSTSDASIATVADGVVTAVKAGTATITAACGNFLATCAVTVEAPFVPVTSISLNKTELSMLDGEWYTLTVTFNPSNATDKAVTWSTSNASVAKLIGPGKIEAGKPGTAVITAECGGKTATCAVTVAALPVAITGITLDPDEVEFYVGESATINVVYSPSDATPEPVSWTWYGSDYATIEEGETSCKLTGIAFGEAYLYAQCGSFRTSCVVTVRERPVQRVATISHASLTLDPKQSFTLTATVDPPLGAGQKLEWYSSDVNIARIDIFSGEVTALKPGTCKIELRCPGAEKVYCDVTVTDHYDVSYFFINPRVGYVKKGGSINMEPLIDPEEASNTPISWSSSDPTIATVDNTGKVSGISEGTVTITAVCGGKTATSQMTVYEDQGGGGDEPGDSIALDKNEITLNPGETYTLTVTKYPEGYGPDDVFWGSDNWDVATVVDGVVTAHTIGVAIIVARIGDYETYCTVKVPLSGGGSGGLDPVTDEPLN